MRLFSLIWEAITDFGEDRGGMLSAALAFYSALALAPVVVLTLWVASLVGEAAQAELVAQFRQIAGQVGGDALRLVIQNAQERPSAGTIAAVISIGALLFAATTVFAQLQEAMNLVWNVDVDAERPLWDIVRKRLLGLAMLGVILLLLLASMLMTAVAERLEAALPGGQWLWPLLNWGIIIVVFAVFIGAIYKVLPDLDIDWHCIWFGAMVTAVLLALGRYLMGLYLRQSASASAYGAAGALVALLLWVYYSWLIVFFGAELTQVWAGRRRAKRGGGE